MASLKLAVQEMWRRKDTVVIILLPLCLLPLLLTVDSKEARCGYVVGVTVGVWVTHSLPLGLTALLPLLILPLTGVSAVHDVSSHYVNDDSMTVLGCLALGVAVSNCGLGRRLSVGILMRTGSSPTWLMLGVMVVTWALTSLMNPPSSSCLLLLLLPPLLRTLRDTKVKRSPSLLARQVVQKALTIRPTVYRGQWRSLLPPRRLSKRSLNRRSKDEEELTEMLHARDELDTTMSPATSKAAYRRICKGLSLSVAYAANIGAACRLSGDLPPLLMQQRARELLAAQGSVLALGEGGWTVFALPSSALCLLLAWGCLSLLFLGPREWRRKKRRDKVKAALIKETLSRQYQKLGPMSFAERAVLGHSLVLLCLFLTAQPPGIPGWVALFPPQCVSTSTAAILVCLSLFVCPAQRPQSFGWRSGSGSARSVPSLLDWRSMQTSLPWEVLLLMGGGHALVRVWGDTGVLGRIVEGVSGWGGGWSPWLLSAVLTALTALLTQIADGASVAHQLTPILLRLAISHEVNPLYFLLPCAMATSLTFLLPLATASNAIVFATGHLKVKDMILSGFVLHVLSALVLTLATHTWGMTYFDLATPLPPQSLATPLPPQSLSTPLDVTTSWTPFNSAPTTEAGPLTGAQSVINSSLLGADGMINATSISADV